MSRKENGETKLLPYIRKILFNKYIWLLFLPLLIVWSMLTSRLENRTNFVLYGQISSVKRIWGGNLEQPMPSVRYKGFGSDVSTLGKGELSASDISVNLEVDYRKKGLVYYTGYLADFNGRYTIRNNENEKIYLSFIFPYPMEQGEGMLRDVKLLVDNKEDPLNTEYQPDLILWTGLLEPSQTVEMSVHYQGRGLNHFIYGFEPGRQINNFKMKIQILGTGEVDYPVSTMTPTRTESAGDDKTLLWDLDRVLTQLNIGVVLPDRINIARQISVMVQRAPVFFLMFLAALCAAVALGGQTLKFVPIAAVSAAYFFFYPLFAYLSAYMNVVVSFLLSFGIIILLIFNYTRIVYDLKIAAAAAGACLFFLGITSAAALLPTYTGLILTIEGVALLALVMQVLSRHKDVKVHELFGLPDPNSIDQSKTKTQNNSKAGQQPERPEEVEIDLENL